MGRLQDGKEAATSQTTRLSLLLYKMRRPKSVWELDWPLCYFVPLCRVFVGRKTEKPRKQTTTLLAYGPAVIFRTVRALIKRLRCLVESTSGCQDGSAGDGR